MSDADLKPWRVTASRPVFQDPWIDVRADTCGTDAGATIAPYYVLNGLDWVNVLALDAQDRVVMVRLYRHGLAQMSLELPGGIMDRTDSSPATAAARELLEETGHTCDPLIPVGWLSPNPANHANRMHIFAARGARLVRPPQREPGETMRMELIPRAEVRRMALAGELVSALHVAAVLMALEQLP